MNEPRIIEMYSYDESIEPYACMVCKMDPAVKGMEDMCADCYWDADYERKKACRSNPVWRFNRIYSFAVTCMGLKNDEAIAFALKEMNLTTPPVATDAKTA